MTEQVAGTVTGKAVRPPTSDNDPGTLYIRVSRTSFEVTRQVYKSVLEGEHVVLSADHPQKVRWTRGVSKVEWTHGTSQTAQQLSVLEDQAARTMAEVVCGVLRKLGIDARVLERDRLPPGPYVGTDHTYASEWVEIAEGPIRWVELRIAFRWGPPLEPLWANAFYCVPDSRMGPDFPVVSVDSVRERYFPLFGSVERVWWRKWTDVDNPRTPFGPYAKSTKADKDFSRRVADSLIQDAAVTRGITILSGTKLDADPRIQSDPDHRWWRIFSSWTHRPEDDWVFTRPTRPVWNSHQAIAQCLLSMPIRADE